MERLQAFKYQLMPNGAEERQLRRFAGDCRYVYNKALDLQIKNHESGGKYLNYNALCKQLTVWRNDPDTPWLADAPCAIEQQKLKDLERAYKNFFDRRGAFPRFKKKGQGDSFRFPDRIKLDQANNRINLPKLGWLRFRKNRQALGEVRSATISYQAGKWWVSILTRREVEHPVPNGGIVGIDLGISRFATLSDGSFFAPIHSFKRYEDRMRKAQQALSRKVKFSNNWKKAKSRVQKIHSRIGNVRRDFLHLASKTISQNHAIVCIEDLQVSNMSKSAKGSVAEPGKNVRAKSGLNKSILDQGWGEFRRQLDYKLAWNGGHLIAVPPQYTSQTCPACGHVSSDNRQTQAKFCCVECGFEENADLVGAINVLSRGMQQLRDEGMDTADASAGRETAAQIACEVNGAVMPSAAGTHRSDTDAMR